VALSVDLEPTYMLKNVHGSHSEESFYGHSSQGN